MNKDGESEEEKQVRRYKDLLIVKEHLDRMNQYMAMANAEMDAAQALIDLHREDVYKNDVLFLGRAWPVLTLTADEVSEITHPDKRAWPLQPGDE